MENKCSVMLYRSEMSGILKFLTWKERVVFLTINKQNFTFFGRDKTWGVLCGILAEQHMLYSPPVLPTGETWRRMFFETLWPIRKMWSEGGDSTAVSSPGGAPNGFKVGVYARFKPVPEKPTASVAGESGTEAENNGHVEDEEKEVTLPLHQRLALIKLSRGLKTNRQALKILMQEGSWFGKKWDAVREERTKAGEGGDDGGPEKPPLPQSTAPKEKLVASVQSIDPTMGRCVMVAPACGLREFSFDGVMKPETQQVTQPSTLSKMDPAEGHPTNSFFTLYPPPPPSPLFS